MADYQDYDQEQNNSSSDKSIKGYRVITALLAIVLIGISILYFNIHKQQQEDYALLQIERDTIQNNLSNLIEEYDGLKYQNDTIAAKLEEANTIMEQLKKERRFNYAKIKQYEREVGTLRAVMKTYLRQIDSLNKINKNLADENISIKKEINTERLRADVAEEKASELQNKVAQGSVLRARDIGITPLNAKDKLVTRVHKAVTLRVDFTISANELATTGNRNVYVRILSPDGILLTAQNLPTFEYNGTQFGYSVAREVDYQNEDVDVSVFYRGADFAAGAYKVEVYADGQLIGGSAVPLR